MTVFRLFRLSLVFSLLTLPGLAQAQNTPQILTVETPRELARALRNAPQGAEIVLAPGDYGRLEIDGDTEAGVIRSADPENPARFTSALVLDVRDIRIEGLHFDYVFAPEDEIYYRVFVFRDLTNFVLRDNIFEGDPAQGISALDDGHGWGIGVTVWHGENVLIEGNEFFGFFRGLHMRNHNNLTVRGNEVHTIRMDGMNFVQVSDVLVEGNHIHNFDRVLDSTDHSDMIQFWTRRTDWSSHNIVIRGNLLNAGSGWFTQSIFMRNERSDMQGSIDPEIFYRNILIEENVIINAHTHGITVGDAFEVTIRNNTVVQVASAAPRTPDAGRYTPAIRVAEHNGDVVVMNNITSRVVGYDGQSDWNVSDNFLVQGNSRLEPGHYSLIFQGGPLQDPASFRYLADGPAATPGLGAGMLRSSHSPVDLLP
ncbi:MAG: right-handed parallel beta-helix repeat-containing protein [Pseudomonadota bacterium]